MIADRISPKPRCRWTFGIVAIVLVIGLLWLALVDGGNRYRSEPASSASLSLVPSALQSNSSNSRQLDLVFLPASLAPTPANPAATPNDNLKVLALGATGAMALTGIALFLAWKLRRNLSLRSRVKSYESLSISRGVSSF